MEKITITRRSEDVITAKSGSKYFMVEDETQRELICFIPELYEHLLVGTGVDADIAPPRKEGGTPQITMVYKDGKPLVEAKTKQGAGRSYGKSKEELTQIRQLAETQNRSIQAQTALNRAVDLALADNFDMPNDIDSIKQIAREFYQILQSLTLISEAKIIHQAIKGANPAENLKAIKKVVADEAGEKTFGEPIDLKWIEASIKQLEWMDVVIWMRKKYEIKGGKGVSGVMEFMNDLQKADFAKEIKDRLEANGLAE